MLKYFLVVAAISASLSGCSDYKYQIVGAGNACAYKIDRETGHVWFVSADGERKLANVP
ncbi:MAG: hypothetical protein WCL42_08050 [Chlorobiaceae bacterium]|jgi:hypothetical protein